MFYRAWAGFELKASMKRFSWGELAKRMIPMPQYYHYITKGPN
jgi:hypothetical protein